jgi:hypothetical protein
MQLLKPKTLKAIRKEFKKLVIKHGAEVVVGLLTGLVTNYLTDKGVAFGKHKKKKGKHKE